MLSYKKDKKLLLTLIFIVSIVSLPICFLLYKFIFKLYTNLYVFILHHIILIVWILITIKLVDILSDHLAFLESIARYRSPTALFAFVVYLIATTTSCYLIGLNFDKAGMYNTAIYWGCNYFFWPLLEPRGME